MSIIKIFGKKFDEEVHSDLLKFGKGEFKNKFLLEAKRKSSKFNIKTGPEYANFLVKECLKKIKEKIKISGVIITTLNLSDNELGFSVKKRGNFQGIKKIEIETEIEPDKILNLIEKYPRVFYALSFKTDEFELKIKPKAPKSGKPGSKGNDEPKADFCSLKTQDVEIVRNLFFDVGEFKEVSVKHIIKINEIIYPKDTKNMKPEEVREKSKRKGILIREVNADGSRKISEAEFEA